MLEKQYQILHDIMCKMNDTKDVKELSMFLTDRYNLVTLSEFIASLFVDSNLVSLTEEEKQIFDNQIQYFPAKIYDKNTKKIKERIYVQSYMASLYHLLCSKYNEVLKNDPDFAKELILKISKIFIY